MSIESIDTAYQLYQMIYESKQWMMIPFFAFAISVIFPAMIPEKNKYYKQRRKIMAVVAGLFFGWMVIMLGIMIGDMPNWKNVEDKVMEHVKSLDCNDLLNFIKTVRADQPRYMSENLQVLTENYYFDNCGVI